MNLCLFLLLLFHAVNMNIGFQNLHGNRAYKTVVYVMFVSVDNLRLICTF